MTRDEAVEVIQVLNAWFPREAIEFETAALWIRELSRMKRQDAALKAADRLAKTQDSFPSLRLFRDAYSAAEKSMRPLAIVESDEQIPIPTEAQEWIANMTGTLIKTVDEA